MCRKKKLCLGYPASIGTAVPALLFSFFCSGVGFVQKKTTILLLSSRPFSFLCVFSVSAFCLACKKLKYKRNLSFREAVLYSG
jgi:hypothetical protein